MFQFLQLLALLAVLWSASAWYVGRNGIVSGGWKRCLVKSSSSMKPIVFPAVRPRLAMSETSQLVTTMPNIEDMHSHVGMADSFTPLTSLKPGLSLEGEVFQCTPVLVWLRVGVFRTASGGRPAEVLASLRREDIDPELLTAFPSGKPGLLFERGTRFPVYVKNVSKNAGTLSVTSFSEQSTNDTSTGKKTIARDRRRRRRILRQIGSAAIGQTVKATVDRVTPSGISIDVTSLGAFPVRGHISWDDLPPDFRLSNTETGRAAIDLMESEFRQGRTLEATLTGMEHQLPDMESEDDIPTLRLEFLRFADENSTITSEEDSTLDEELSYAPLAVDVDEEFNEDMDNEGLDGEEIDGVDVRVRQGGRIPKDPDQLTDEFTTLANGKSTVSLTSFLKWDPIVELLSQARVSRATVEMYMRDTGLSDPLCRSDFTRLAELIRENAARWVPAEALSTAFEKLAVNGKVSLSSFVAWEPIKEQMGRLGVSSAFVGRLAAAVREDESIVHTVSTDVELDWDGFQRLARALLDDMDLEAATEDLEDAQARGTIQEFENDDNDDYDDLFDIFPEALYAELSDKANGQRVTVGHLQSHEVWSALIAAGVATEHELNTLLHQAIGRKRPMNSTTPLSLRHYMKFGTEFSLYISALEEESNETESDDSDAESASNTPDKEEEDDWDEAAEAAAVDTMIDDFVSSLYSEVCSPDGSVSVQSLLKHEWMGQVGEEQLVDLVTEVTEQPGATQLNDEAQFQAFFDEFAERFEVFTDEDGEEEEEEEGELMDGDWEDENEEVNK